jgi:TetR/AcrR family transcriptional repressor of nem operon
MRYPLEHKDRIHHRIVRAASRRLRLRGGEGVPIAGLMRELHLTHGGFYRHFDNKEQLFTEAITDGFEEVGAMLVQAAEQALPGHEVRALIETYLSPQHCEKAAEGCPFAALVSEIGRQPRGVRTAFESALRAHARRIAQFLPGTTEEEREGNFAVLFSGMAGTLGLARAVSDSDARGRMLEAAKALYIKAFAA